VPAHRRSARQRHFVAGYRSHTPLYMIRSAPPAAAGMRGKPAKFAEFESEFDREFRRPGRPAPMVRRSAGVPIVTRQRELDELVA
jgi:hypothetical protein